MRKQDLSKAKLFITVQSPKGKNNLHTHNTNGNAR